MSKSKLHIELAQRALVWLEGRATNRGIRGCEEVILDNGYVADSVALSGLTYKNEKLFGVATDRWRNEESEDLAWIFESKVSRSDYLNTFKSGNRLTPIGNFHFIVTPRGLVKPEEVPSFWGLLEQSGQGLTLRKIPTLQYITIQKVHEIGYLILRYSKHNKFTLYSEDVERFRADQEFTLTP